MDFGKCKKCSKKAVTAIDAGDVFLCAYHYVKQEDDECLKARLQSDIDEHGRIKEDKEIQKEIKKQRPELYKQLKNFFEV